MKILVVGPSWIGDMVMSQSLYTTLKSQHPNASIDVLAPDWCLPLLERMPEVDGAIAMPVGHGSIGLATRFKLAKKLKRNGYDIAYVLPHSIKSAIIPWLANIPKRVGWQKREPRFVLLNDQRKKPNQYSYMVERYCALAHSQGTLNANSNIVQLNRLPTPKFTVDKSAQEAATKRLSLSVESEVIGLCPGAEFGPAKKWPEAHYASVAQSLAEQGKQVWLFGSQKDLATCESILNLVDDSAKPNIKVLAGQTSLIDAVDLLAACKTVVANDSGLMHIAAAVGCNIVAIYGSTSPDYTPPLTEQCAIVHTDIECRPCFKRTCPFGHLKCLTDISSRTVLDKISAF
ncbi:lipopolysaccharide heptosyltransferase II [Vibrio ulleungensis]|uniref:lipopolysaccharide heptosyltransferase II n=1 Tax=Vibrio ulleungensis TaxID=2807619 RepID=A0ABS2HN90_9VIBR|nr:lipopolysaccharide heptosyltransferase II [Vibrio ulleungensis]MBM7037673.1 lipopolysaccharide heptosyltransferase II [Vibrio ulleungensis]